MPPNAPNFYTTDQVAELLHRHIKTIQKMCKSGELGHIRDGHTYLISDDQLADWVARHSVDVDDLAS